jgi:two-component system NtrC family response regulator
MLPRTIGDPIIGDAIIGDAPRIRELRALIARFAHRAEPVLIEGETGSGKELVAQALHVTSGRPGRFVPFNVCAIPDTMFEDALFGHVRGAFTGALGESPGYLLEADRGTAYFDEVSALSGPMQAKLLRAIETGEFRPVGARVDKHSQFRVVASVNEPMRDLVRTNRFRLDLSYRLGALVLKVPPLRERREDLPALVAVFAERASGDGGVVPFSSEAMRVLSQYDWPGNVRELRNVVTTAVAIAEGPTVEARVVLDLLGENDPMASGPEVVVRRRDQLLEVLERLAWNTREVARELRIDRATVYRRMAALGISPVVRSSRRTRQESRDG